MANPQCENGYIRIANEFFEALIRAGIPQNAMQVFLAIMRFTWGYNRKEARIRLKDFSRITGMRKYHVSRELKRLRAANMVTSVGKLRTLTYGIQKDYEKWKRLPKQVTLPNQVTKGYLNRQLKVTQIGNQNGRKALPIKDQREAKDILLNTIYKDSSFDETEKLTEEEIQRNLKEIHKLAQGIGWEIKPEKVGYDKGEDDIPF